MRQAFLLALMISLLLTAGCKSHSRQEENFTNWKEQFLLSDELSITAVVKASSDDTVSKYKLVYEKRGDTESVEILEPELISKVKAYIKSGETELSYDGAVLETGNLAEEQLSPMRALPTFIEFLEEGHLKGVWTEKTNGENSLTAELQLSDGSHMLLWINESSGQLLAASIHGSEAAEIMIDF
ncbi:MAG: hypothetical protein GX025_06600 [Clostridiales bacterium]|nr:hypothetical protein [Clostridiales bacterium]